MQPQLAGVAVSFGLATPTRLQHKACDLLGSADIAVMYRAEAQARDPYCQRVYIELTPHAGKFG